MVAWCLEHRMTAGMDVQAFYQALELPPYSVVTQRIGLNDPQRLGYWRSQGRLPAAVYLALVEAYGQGRTVPPVDFVTVRQPTRLPAVFERFLEGQPAETPGPSAPVAPVSPVPPAAVVEVDPPASVPAEGPAPASGLQLSGDATLTIRLEVSAPPPAPPILPERERQLLRRIQELQDEVAELMAKSHGLERQLPTASHVPPPPGRRS